MNKNERIERKMEKPTLVVSAVILQDGKYLLVRDNKFNFWRPPGGRVNWGEKVDDALKREMKEEIGTDIEIVRALGFGEDFAFKQTLKYKTHRVVIYFLCKAKTKIKSYRDEGECGARIKWISIGELMAMKDTEPAFKDMINRFDLRNPLKMKLLRSG